MIADQQILQSRVLILDDQEDNVHLLKRLLTRRGYTNLRCLTDAREFFAAYADFQPDLILLDLHMPYLDGYEILERLASTLAPGTYLPILVLTANITPEAKRRAFSAGAKDFIHKPFDTTEVLLRAGNLLQTRHLHLQLLQQNQNLEQRVQDRTRALQEAKLEILRHLARAAEFRDDDTGDHQQRVGWLSALLAQRLGLPEDEIERIRLAAPLHDVGKIGIPDAILLKPGRLTDSEFAFMKTHTTVGAAIFADCQYGVLVAAREIALTHHERWDGTGYPYGLAGEAIPLRGRIVAVADIFDALTHSRTYKAAWPMAAAVEEIGRMSGTHLDPTVVSAFMDLVRSGSIASIQALDQVAIAAAG
ncbi:MAG TPA: HD domain-containing phosphohydrolase [Symbiobacteriaceae bacterium]|nr:HD domain-containing phosphohydrolase [Symbiobacteriaceae bacterium]